ncbi:hypothetical protein [Absidia glauca]|uniref:Uncharacterized protein n=1 Tax=Absidia glauca TaxID=4829 RepID=A0A168MPC9_ABSGL|nr:hypothetical protein [Absidia glauca]
MKTVRFNPTLENIGYTYSAAEYDRSHFFSSPPSPPPSFPNTHRPYIAPLDLSPRPKLMINTEMTSDPLFFTHLSTHYRDEEGWQVPPPSLETY